VLQELRRHCEIALSRADVDVAEKGRQWQQQSLHVLAGLIPMNDSMDSGAMSNVVQTRRCSDAAIATDVGRLAHSTKHGADMAVAPSTAGLAGKESGALSIGQWPMTPLFDIGS